MELQVNEVYWLELGPHRGCVDTRVEGVPVGGSTSHERFKGHLSLSAGHSFVTLVFLPTHHLLGIDC